MKIKTARICLDCGEIHDSELCPECLSRSWWYLDKWLTRDAEHYVTYPEVSVALAETLMDELCN